MPTQVGDGATQTKLHYSQRALPQWRSGETEVAKIGSSEQWHLRELCLQLRIILSPCVSSQAYIVMYLNTSQYW